MTSLFVCPLTCLQPGSPAPEGDSYIAASYVKWIEVRGISALAAHAAEQALLPSLQQKPAVPHSLVCAACVRGAWLMQHACRCCGGCCRLLVHVSCPSCTTCQRQSCAEGTGMGLAAAAAAAAAVHTTNSSSHEGSCRGGRVHNQHALPTARVVLPLAPHVHTEASVLDLSAGTAAAVCRGEGYTQWCVAHCLKQAP
jgi:hypothetical protein